MRRDKQTRARRTPRRPSAARLACAEAEDRLDEEWWEQCKRVWRNLENERGLTGFDVFLAFMKTVPPRPPGFERRREHCNRCGQRTEMNHDYDALYCGRCNRWIESKCSDPACMYCSKRPERPVP
ncbi:MAG: hypothetical protein ABSH34_23640 [Verrucomicrobiota bacterium]